MNTTVLSLEDIRLIAQNVGLDGLMDELIRRTTAALRAFDSSKMQIPVRQGFQYEHPTLGLVEWMPAHRLGEAISIKIVGYHPDNPDRDSIPTILSTVYKFDTKTGHLVAMADATFLTALRTGAASAVASSVLASPQSSNIALIGSGAQAVTQLHALSRVLDLTDVYAYDTDPATTHSFKDRAAFVGLPIHPVSRRDLQNTVANADVICTSTSVEIGKGPVFEDTSVKPWVHINAVGSDFPGKTELPVSLLKRSYVCPDTHAQAVIEGECQQLDPHEIGPDLVDLIQNKHKHLLAQHQRTVFDSTGWALEDQIALDMMLDYAEELGVGQQVAIESYSVDPKDPYQFITAKNEDAVGSVASRSARSGG